MPRYFSPSTGSFYDEAIHGARKIEEPNQSVGHKAAGRKPRLIDNPDCKLPADAVAITDARWAELMKAQSQGKAIIAQGNRPVAVDPVRSAEELLEANIRRRNRLLSASDWTQLPDALASQPEYKAAMAVWRQALRDMDLQAGIFPEEPQP